jgi:hypothetical protein
VFDRRLAQNGPRLQKSQQIDEGRVLPSAFEGASEKAKSGI